MISRINFIVNHYQLSPSKFADEIDVQRSNISHILSGRNKPSLDFIQKILMRWHEINPEWLIMGNGNFIKNSPAVNNNPDIKSSLDKQDILSEESKPIYHTVSSTVIAQASEKTISRIVIFFSNGSFEEYIK